MNRLFLSAVLALVLVPAAAHASPRMDRLMNLFMLNESAAAYVRHCTLGVQMTDKPFFVGNANAVGMAVIDQLLAENKGLTPEEAGDLLLEKRKSISDNFDLIYKGKNACASEAANMGKEHFNSFGLTGPKVVQSLIANIDKDPSEVAPAEPEPPKPTPFPIQRQ